MLPLLKFGQWSEKNHAHLRVFDLLCAAGMLGWGAYAHSRSWLACGSLVLLIVWYDPLPRLRRWLPQVVAAKAKQQQARGAPPRQNGRRSP